MSTATIHLEGNLGKAPEIKTTSSGGLFAKFSVATTERKKDSAGNWSDGDTSWWNCTAWEAGEMVVENLGKGDPVTLDGRVKIRTYEVNGETKQSVEITVTSIGLNLAAAKRKNTQSRQQYDDSVAPF